MTHRSCVTIRFSGAEATLEATLGHRNVSPRRGAHGPESELLYNGVSNQCLNNSATKQATVCCIGYFWLIQQTLSHSLLCLLHTHPFNGPLSGTTQVSRYQKGKTSLDFAAARDSEWQWHQLGHMQVCISIQTDNHANTPPLSFYRPDALPAAQPTASKH